MLAQLKRTRDLTYRMLERTRRPAQITDLYLIAGQLSGLMARVSFDLGHPEAASEQARAALVYGQVINHNTLRAWAWATLSMIAFWSGRPSEGVAHAHAGLEHVSAGEVAVRLHAVAARSWALVGSRDDAVTALHSAQEVRQHVAGADPFADGVGSEFAFGPARQELSAGSTLLSLGEASAAAKHAHATLALYEVMPPEQHRTGGLHGARVDLATARVMELDLDAAREALAPTLVLAPEQRTERIRARMRSLRRQVSTARFQGSIQASALADDIEEFGTSSAVVWALPDRA